MSKHLLIQVCRTYAVFAIGVLIVSIPVLVWCYCSTSKATLWPNDFAFERVETTVVIMNLVTSVVGGIIFLGCRCFSISPPRFAICLALATFLLCVLGFFLLPPVQGV